MDFSPDQLDPGSMGRLQPRTERMPIAAPGDSPFTNGHHPFAEACNEVLAEFHGAVLAQ